MSGTTRCRRAPKSIAVIGTPCGLCHSGEIAGHCAAGAVKRLFGCAAFSTCAGVHGRPCRSTQVRLHRLRVCTGKSLQDDREAPAGLGRRLPQHEAAGLGRDAPVDEAHVLARPVRAEVEQLGAGPPLARCLLLPLLLRRDRRRGGQGRIDQDRLRRRGGGALGEEAEGVPGSQSERRERVEAPAREAGVDSLLTVYHSCHRELCGEEGNQPFQIENFMTVLGQAMGFEYPDRTKTFKLYEDMDRVLAEAGDLLRAHGIDPERARSQLQTALYGPSPTGQNSS